MLCSQLHIRVFGTCFFNLNMYVNVGMVKPAWQQGCIADKVNMLCSQLHIRVFGTCFFNLNMYVNVGMVKPAWGRCVDNSVENLTETGFPRCKENLLRPSLLTHLNGGIMNLEWGPGACEWRGCSWPRDSVPLLSPLHTPSIHSKPRASRAITRVRVSGGVWILILYTTHLVCCNQAIMWYGRRAWMSHNGSSSK